MPELTTKLNVPSEPQSAVPSRRLGAFVGAPAQFKNRRLLVVDAAGGKPQDILGTWQYEPGNITWLNDGQIMMAM